MRNLIPTFPREFAFPSRRLVKTETDFYNKVNNSNKLKNVYFSLYCCTDKRNFENTHIDKLYFDFDMEDGEKVSDVEKKKSIMNYYNLTDEGVKLVLEKISLYKYYKQYQQDYVVKQVMKLSDYFKAKDYKHLICFSGKKGFHVYLFTSNYEFLVHKRDCIRNAYVYFMETLKETAGIEPDPHCKDLRRISRVPNTWHMEGRRYCIPVNRYDLEQGFEHVKEKAKQQSFEFKYYGSKLFDVSQFDYKSFCGANGDIPEYDYKIDDEKMDNAMKRFLPCVQCWLLDTDNMGTWKARYYFAVYCRDMGMPKSLCNKLAKKYFSKVINKGTLGGRGSNYEHFCQVNALEYGYGRGDLFPNCKSLFDEGLCKGQCKKYNKTGSPLYK